MIIKATGRELGLDILKAMGVDPRGIRGFELRCFTGEVATIRIERLIDVAYDVSELDSAFRSTRPGRVVKSELIEIEPRETCCGKDGE